MALVNKPAVSQRWPIPALILKSLSRNPALPDYPGGTQLNVGDNALRFVYRTVPDFRKLIQGKTVLDYGCGCGDQAIAMLREGAQHVTGYDPYPKFPANRTGLTFTSTLPNAHFDVILSCSAFEHFESPEVEVQSMRKLLKPGGIIVITWAEPWYSHSGSHTSFFTRMPWVNLLFSEKTVMLVRSLYRDDGATRYSSRCTNGGAVNRMTISKFEKIVRQSGLTVLRLNHLATKGLPFVTRIPVLRELLTSASTAILT